MSIGVSGFQEKDEFPMDIFKRADKALYEAKEMGRNLVSESQRSFCLNL